MKLVRSVLLLGLLLGLFSGCNRDSGDGSSGGASTQSSKKPVVGVAFDTLQTEYWVASINAMEAELQKRGYDVIRQVADNDASRQLQQINNLISKKVDGIIVAPKDAQTVIPMIKAANRANIPIVLYNRPPADNSGKSVTVVADNFEITKNTVTYMAEQAKKSGS